MIHYQLWDVFTSSALTGNPLAVIPDATGLSSETMQRLAQEFNLSETSFLLPSDKADVRARFFTPARELPMAGHPSIGSLYALHHLGRVGGEKVRLELAVGVREMRLEWAWEKLARVWMNQGAPELGEIYEDKAAVAGVLGLAASDLDPDLPVQLGSAGVPFLYVPVRSLEALARAHVTPQSLSELMADDHKAVFVFTLQDKNVRARMLGLALGIVEDPATGSAHGPLGAYLRRYGMLEEGARFVSHQGVEMGRASEIHVRLQGDEVEVGGTAVLVGEGKLYL